MATPVIIYDDACPMCRGYTKLFDRFGWSGRTSFSTLEADTMDKLDLDRARHEIPLFDPESGRIQYGIDSHMTVLGRGIPALRPLFDHPLVKAVLMPLYWLITYNRRVIAGTRPPETGFDCAPDYHVGWRVAYILLAAGACGLIGSLAPAFIALLLAGFTAGLFISHDRLNLAGSFATLALGATLIAVFLPAFLAALFVAVEAIRRLGL